MPGSSRSVSRSPSPRRERSRDVDRRRSPHRSGSRSVSPRSPPPRSPPPRSRGGGGRSGGGGGERYSRRSRSTSLMSDRKRHVGTRVEDDPEPSKCLGIFGLSTRTSEADLRDVFDRYHGFSGVKLITDHYTHVSRGFGFINFETSDDARYVKDKCIGMDIDGRNIRIDFSTTSRPHTPTPGKYMGRPNPSYYQSQRRGPPPPRYEGGGRGGGYYEYEGRGGGGGGGRYGDRDRYAPQPRYESRRRSRSRSPRRSYSRSPPRRYY
ncbi:transformer-2 protein homolog beta-like isoform X1 [Symsagittifera roscoffensis]|uniref:transformer-2 protein homolog beta-like isoform X1 n=1 Tax=Symsagittifera roscoffensis TaxID=84072 RepID=UPI00307B3315